MMKIGIACDHAGVILNDLLVGELKSRGYDIVPVGSNAPYEDYPDAANIMAVAIQNKLIDRGILICGSGVGVSIAANKFRGIRASVCHDSYSARQGVEHDRMNILCLGSRVIGVELAKELTLTFLKASFSDEERHIRRSNKIENIEEQQFK